MIVVWTCKTAPKFLVLDSKILFSDKLQKKKNLLNHRFIRSLKLLCTIVTNTEKKTKSNVPTILEEGSVTESARKVTERAGKSGDCVIPQGTQMDAIEKDAKKIKREEKTEKRRNRGWVMFGFWSSSCWVSTVEECLTLIWQTQGPEIRSHRWILV